MLSLHRDIACSEDVAKAYGRLLEKNYADTGRNSVKIFKAGTLFFQKLFSFGQVKSVDFRRLRDKSATAVSGKKC